METDNRVEFAGVAIAAFVIGIGALLFIAADAGVWAWLVLGLGLILAAVIVVRAMARRNRRPALAAVPPPVAVAPLDGRFRLLVIADDSCTSAAFRDSIVGHAAGRSTEVLVVAPALGSRLARWTGDESAYADAQTHLDDTLRALADLGIDASGRIGPNDPLQAADDGLREFAADEVLFAVRADAQSSWLEDGVVEAARSRYAVAVAHVSV